MTKKLLVIEDDADTRMLLEEVFSSCGCLVDAVTDVPETVEYLSSQSSPDLVLSDLSVPGAGHNGEIIDVIRSHCPDKNVSIVLLSGNSEIGKVAKKFNVKYLKKPVEIDDLLGLIN